MLGMLFVLLATTGLAGANAHHAAETILGLVS
jgi:hypothetical protein